MMRSKKKIVLSVVIAAITAFLAAASAFAKTTMDDVVFDLNTLGIMQGDENGDMQLDKEITRAEFACIAVRLMNRENTANSISELDKFKDVPKDHWAKRSIEYLSSINVINGVSENEFAPDESVSCQQVSKMLVSILGYSNNAEVSGGYPNGYTSEASRIGLLDGVNAAADPFTRAQVARMVYNALDINIMTLINNGIYQKYEESDTTYRDGFKVTGSESMEKLTGIVTATAAAYMHSANENMEDNQIEINDKIYYMPDNSANKYFGQKVDFFVEEPGSNVIVSIKASSENHITNIKIKSFDQLTSEKLRYYVDGKKGARSSVSISSDVVFLKNNRVVFDWNEESIDSEKAGDIVTIDNNDDGYAEVIMVNEYSSVIVDYVSEDGNSIYFKDGSKLNDKQYINIDPDDNMDKYIMLTDKDGANLEGTSINKEDTLTAYVSEDGTYIKLVVSHDTVEGNLTEISDETVVIAGEEYDIESENATSAVSVGDDVTAYINFNGEVVYMKKGVGSSADSYAYVIDVYQEEDGDSYALKLLLPDLLKENKEEVDNEDGGEASVISKLACNNKDIINVRLADSYTYDGDKCRASMAKETLKGKVISYHENSDGIINRVTSPEVINTSREKYYNSYERTFGKTKGGAFGVDLTTQTICIPKDNPSASYEDYMVSVEMNNGQLYTVKGYDKNETSYVADLIVVEMTMEAGTQGLINTKSDVGMVQKYTTEAEDDEIVHRVELLTKEGKQTYKITEAFEDGDEYEDLREGDLIAYSLDNNFEMDAFKIMGRMKSKLNFGLNDYRGDYETFAGYALNIKYNQVSEDLNRWVSLLECGYGEDESVVRTYEVLKNGTPPIFTYDRKSGEVGFGDLREIALAGDEIYVCAAVGTVRAIVIIK